MEATGTERERTAVVEREIWFALERSAHHTEAVRVRLRIASAEIDASTKQGLSNATTLGCETKFFGQRQRWRWAMFVIVPFEGVGGRLLFVTHFENENDPRSVSVRKSELV